MTPKPRPWRNILVTGASGGLGLAMARLLVGPGTHLLLSGRDAARLGEALAACTAAGATAAMLVGDLADPAGVSALKEAVGDVDLLVANAGIHEGRVKGALVETGAVARHVLEVNLLAAVDVIHAVLPGMLARRRGRIVIIASLAALSPIADAPAYSASKAGLLLYGLSLRSALRGTGVSVQVICPGYVDTAMGLRHQGNRPDAWSAERAARWIVRAIDRNPAVSGFPFWLYLVARLSLLSPEWVREAGSSGLRYHIGDAP